MKSAFGEKNPVHANLIHGPLHSSFPINTAFRCSVVYVVQCRPPHERSIDRNITHQLEDLRAKGIGKWGIQEFIVRETGELLNALEKIALEVKSDEQSPVLHFDAHGSETQGIEIGESGEFLSWSALKNHLRRINVAASFGLGVVMSACAGFLTVAEVEIKRAAPFRFLLGSTGKPNNGLLEDKFPRFYETLSESEDFADAADHLSDFTVPGTSTPLFLLFSAEHLLGESFLDWYRTECSFEGRRSRKEELVTRYKWEHPGVTIAKLRQVRQAAKRVVRRDHSIETYRRDYSSYLPFHLWSFTLQDLVKWDKNKSGH